MTGESISGTATKLRIRSLGVAAKTAAQVPRLRLEHADARAHFKRAGDLLCVVLMLPIVIPVSLLIGAAIFADSPGPILYRATRIGRGGRSFQMLKFRKMTRDAAGSGLTLANDDRFTPIGRFLSVSRLDELPQLWNVLRGQMRLVGPRPETVDFVASHHKEYEEILSVHPGITGPAQIQHFNEGVLLDGQDDPVRHYVEEILPRKVELDLEYVRGWTLWQDTKLLLSTFMLPGRVAAMQLGELLHVPPQRLRAGVVVTLAALVLVVAFSAGTGPAR